MNRIVQVMLFSGFLFSAGVAHAVEADLNRLKTIWNDQRSSMQTVWINYRVFQRGVDNGVLNCTPQELEVLLQESFSELDADPIRAFLSRVFTSTPEIKDPWSFGEFVSEDAKRSDFLEDEKFAAQYTFNGELDFVKSVRPHGTQVEIWNRDQAFYSTRRLDDFLFIPNEELFENRTVSIETVEDERLRIQMESLTLVIDSETGMLRRYEQLDGNGDFHKNIFQEGVMSIENGPDFPRLIVTARYDAKMLSLLTVISIDRVLLNQEMAPEAFLVMADQGTTLIDHRSNEMLMQTLQSSVEDITESITKAQEIVLNEPILSPPPGKKTKWSMIALSFALVVMILTRWLNYRADRRTKV